MEAKELLDELSRAPSRAIRNTVSWEDTQDVIYNIYKDFGEIVFPDRQFFYLLQDELRLAVIEYIELLSGNQYVERTDLRGMQCCLEEYLGVNRLEIELREFFEILVGRPLVWAAGGLLTADYTYSELTGQHYWVSDPDLVWVRCRYDDQPLLEVEAEGIAFLCQRAGCWYSLRDFDVVEIEGETFCLENVINDVFEWTDGSYHWEPEPNLGLRGYHEGYRTRPSGGRRLSLELEVEVGSVDPTFGDAVRAFWDEAEEDSSLGMFGAELIVGFVPISEVERKINEICNVLARYDCHVPSQFYGFHISASVSGWGLTECQIEKLARVFYSNRDLVFQIARRESNRFCRWQNDLDRINLERSKYYALRRDGDRLEFRIFRASVDARELIACANLVQAFLEFALSSHTSFATFWQAWNNAA